MAEMIITVSPEGELVVRSEGLTRADWEQATSELRAVLGEPTRQAVLDAHLAICMLKAELTQPVS